MPFSVLLLHALFSRDDGVRHPGMEHRKRVKPPKRSKKIASKSIMWG